MTTKPTVLDILRLAPKTNCGQCGFPTCMASSAALVSGKASLDACPFLGRDALAAAGLFLSHGDTREIDPDTALLHEPKDKVAGLDLGARAGGLGGRSRTVEGERGPCRNGGTPVHQVSPARIRTRTGTSRAGASRPGCRT